MKMGPFKRGSFSTNISAKLQKNGLTAIDFSGDLRNPIISRGEHKNHLKNVGHCSLGSDILK